MVTPEFLPRHDGLSGTSYRLSAQVANLQRMFFYVGGKPPVKASRPTVCVELLFTKLPIRTAKKQLHNTHYTHINPRLPLLGPRACAISLGCSLCFKNIEHGEPSSTRSRFCGSPRRRLLIKMTCCLTGTRSLKWPHCSEKTSCPAFQARTRDV